MDYLLSQLPSPVASVVSSFANLANSQADGSSSSSSSYLPLLSVAASLLALYLAVLSAYNAFRTSIRLALFTAKWGSIAALAGSVYLGATGRGEEVQRYGGWAKSAATWAGRTALGAASAASGGNGNRGGLRGLAEGLAGAAAGGQRKTATGRTRRAANSREKKYGYTADDTEDVAREVIDSFVEKAKSGVLEFLDPGTAGAAGSTTRKGKKKAAGLGDAAQGMAWNYGKRYWDDFVAGLGGKEEDRSWRTARR